MTYEEFIEQVKIQVADELGDREITFYPEGYESDDPEMQEFIQDTNWKLVGEGYPSLLTDILTIKEPEDQLLVQTQRIAIKKLYEKAEKEGFDAAFQEIRDIQKQIDMAQVDRSRLDDRSSNDYEKIRAYLIIRPLNYSLHMADLKGCVYRKVSDFVLALYQLLGDGNHVMTTSKIKRSEVKAWGVTEEQAIEDALRNTARLYPASVCDQRTMNEENFLEGDFTREDITMHLHSDMLLLSAKGTTNGAVSIFYPGVIEKMMKIMGGPFQAVMMNINDILIFDMKDRKAVNFLKQAKESSDMGEMLSERIYMCDEKGFHAGMVVKVYPDGKATVE